MPPRLVMPLLVMLGALIWHGADTVAWAGQDVQPGWLPLGGPTGRVTNLVAGSASALYATSVTAVERGGDQAPSFDSGNSSRSDALYASHDGGATWQPLTNDLIPGPISTLYADPVTGYLYVGIQGLGDPITRRYGLWRSTDEGGSWLQVPLGRDDLSIWRMARSADNRYLYLGATEATSLPDSYVYRSVDDGRTWSRFQALRYGQSPGSVLIDLVPHASDPNRLYVTTYGGEIYVSADAATSWAATGGPGALAPTGEPGPVQLAVTPDRPETLLAARGYGGGDPGALVIARSMDSGATWTKLPATGLPTKGAARNLAGFQDGIYLLTTDLGTYRSADEGLSWQLLEGPLSSGGVSAFATLPRTNSEAGSAAPTTVLAPTLLASTGYGVFVSRDLGALWQPLGASLPFNSRIAGLLTHTRQPDRILAISDNRMLKDEVAPPLVLRSTEGSRGSAEGEAAWTPIAQGLPDVTLTAWTVDPGDPDTVFLASSDRIFRTTDAGLTWLSTVLTASKRSAVRVAPSDPAAVYLGGRPAMRSTDRGTSWQEMPVALPGQERQLSNVTGLVVDAQQPQHLWAGLDGGGVYETADGGRTWREFGLAEKPIRWLAGGATDGQELYAGVTQDGIYRWAGSQDGWTSVSQGLPEHSTILALIPDPRKAGTLWAARDSGGVYRSTDDGAEWTNVASGLGDNLVQALAIDYSTPDGVLLGTATAGVWALRPDARLSTAPRAVDGRMEIVWPHDWAPVEQAKLANLGLRLLAPDSLVPPPCGWTPRVTVWQALDTEPAELLGEAKQRSVDGHVFPYWELNDVDVSAANDPAHKLYFMIQVAGAETETSIWAHGQDARTYFPQQDVPSGLANGQIGALDARIEIVWPHDAAGNLRPVSEASYANVAVALFKHGTRLSVPVGWEPSGLALNGAWNQEAGRTLAREAVVSTRKAGAITYPIWEFNNIPVARAADLADKLYLWVTVDGTETHPTIWTHGADARTFFPSQDEPIQGCVP